MAVVQISRSQLEEDKRTLVKLAGGELSWAVDSELYW